MTKEERLKTYKIALNYYQKNKEDKGICIVLGNIVYGDNDPSSISNKGYKECPWIFLNGTVEYFPELKLALDIYRPLLLAGKWDNKQRAKVLRKIIKNMKTSE